MLTIRLEKAPLAQCELTIDYLRQLMSVSADHFDNPPVEVGAFARAIDYDRR